MFVALVASQLGVFTRAQALNHGFTDTMIRRRLQTGGWLPVRRGIYRLATSRETWRQRVVGACLYGGPFAFASHRCAAALLQVDGFGYGPIEISSPRRISATPGVSVRRVVRPPVGDVQNSGPILVSSATRTLIEIAAVVDDETLDIALDDVLRRRLTSLPRLYWRLDKIGAHGMSGARRLRTFLRERDPKALPESALERRFLRFLKAHGLPPPPQIQRVIDDDGFVARVDFAYPASKVIIEVDSYRYHSGKVAWERDRARRNRLEALGWCVLHTTAEQMRRRPEDILLPMIRLLPHQLELPDSRFGELRVATTQNSPR